VETDAAAGAPHRRERVWVVAYAGNAAWRTGAASGPGCARELGLHTGRAEGASGPAGDGAGLVADASGHHEQRHGETVNRPAAPDRWTTEAVGGRGCAGHVADADREPEQQPEHEGEALRVGRDTRLVTGLGSNDLADAGDPRPPCTGGGDEHGVAVGLAGDGTGEDEGWSLDDADTSRPRAPQYGLQAGRQAAIGAGWWAVECGVCRVAHGLAERLDRR
jgi:hypothetical protein